VTHDVLQQRDKDGQTLLAILVASQYGRYITCFKFVFHALTKFYTAIFFQTASGAMSSGGCEQREKVSQAAFSQSILLFG